MQAGRGRRSRSADESRGARRSSQRQAGEYPGESTVMSESKKTGKPREPSRRTPQEGQQSPGHSRTVSAPPQAAASRINEPAVGHLGGTHRLARTTDQAA